MSVVQIGLDLATSAAIVGSLVVFLADQRRRARAARQASIDTSVRAVAVQALDRTIDSLSRQHFEGTLEPYAQFGLRLSNLRRVAQATPEDDGGASAVLNHLFRDRFDLVETMLGDANAVLNGLARFDSELGRQRFALYPLLDALPEGGEIIRTVEKRTDEVVAHVVAARTLLRDLHPRLVQALGWVRDNCTEGADGKIEIRAEADWAEVAADIRGMLDDPANRRWVDLMLPADWQETYWSEAPDRAAAQANMRQRLLIEFVVTAFHDPGKLSYNVLELIAEALIDATAAVKDMLVVLAAVHHALLRRDEDGERLTRAEIEALVVRYRSEAMFGGTRSTR